MVQITNALERVKKDGTSFTVLEISGGAELVLSQSTNRYYSTIRRCTMRFTGTLEVAKMLICYLNLYNGYKTFKTSDGCEWKFL